MTLPYAVRGRVSRNSHRLGILYFASLMARNASSSAPVTLAGPPVTIDTGATSAGYLFDAAIPVDRGPDKPIPPDSRVQLKQTYGGKVLKVALRGPYSQITSTYDKIEAYIAAHGIETNGQPWEEYVNDPMTVKESEILTNIYFPIK